jgi:hypothetical protein
MAVFANHRCCFVDDGGRLIEVFNQRTFVVDRPSVPRVKVSAGAIHWAQTSHGVPVVFSTAPTVTGELDSRRSTPIAALRAILVPWHFRFSGRGSDTVSYSVAPGRWAIIDRSSSREVEVPTRHSVWELVWTQRDGGSHGLVGVDESRHNVVLFEAGRALQLFSTTGKIASVARAENGSTLAVLTELGEVVFYCTSREEVLARLRFQVGP